MRSFFMINGQYTSLVLLHSAGYLRLQQDFTYVYPHEKKKIKSTRKKIDTEQKNRKKLEANLDG